MIYDPKGVIPCIVFMDEVNALMIIWVRGGEQLGHGFISPGTDMAQKGVSLAIFSLLWIIY